MSLKLYNFLHSKARSLYFTNVIAIACVFNQVKYWRYTLIVTRRSQSKDTWCI